MRFFLLWMTLMGVAPQSLATNGVSAHRPPHISWQSMVKTMQPEPLKSLRGTSVDDSKPIPEIDFNGLTRWKDYAQILQNFKKLRDLKFIPEPLNPNIKRRSTWLYPDDGCYARAALMRDNIENMGESIPTKIFVYGDLLVKTDNSVSGMVSWWYHVALIVTDGQEKYVLDPALDPHRPLLLQEWLEKMGDPNRMNVSLCSSTSYIPYSPCRDALATEDDTAFNDQSLFLSLERYRLQELGRNADEELGDHPPWVL